MKFEYTNEIELSKKSPEETPHYDERQKLVRYQCFTHAFIVLAVLILLNIFLVEPGESKIPWFNWWNGSLICIIIAFTVAMVEAVARDAYYPPKAKDSLLWCAFDTLIMLACAGAWYYSATRNCALRGELLIENGVLHDLLINPATFLLLAIIPLAAFIKVLITRARTHKSSPEDEE